MSLTKPYFLTYRPNKKKESSNLYMHDRYTQNRWQIRKSVELLYKDFETLFEFIEPCDDNEGCFSLRTYELFLRTCTEVESNMKMIMVRNGYKSNVVDPKLGMADYCKLNKTHFLSSFEVFVPNWGKDGSMICPFAAWKNGISESDTLPWYQAYNNVKHNRQVKFREASLRNMIEALCGLLVLLAAQFKNDHFADNIIPNILGYFALNDGLSDSIGTPFRIKFPDYPDEDMYDFKWEEIKGESDPYTQLKF